MESASSAWEIEHAVFLRRVQTIIAIGFFSAYRTVEEPTHPWAVQSALAALRNADPIELFGVLPADRGQSANVVEGVRLLSNGLTPGSAILWERLVRTARTVLDTQAVFSSRSQVVDTNDEPFRTVGTLTTEPHDAEG